MNIHWKEILKFFSGAFFVTAGASWYFWWLHVAVPFPFFGFQMMTPEFLGMRGFIHFTLFVLSFYFGFVKKSKALVRFRVPHRESQPDPAPDGAAIFDP